MPIGNCCFKPRNSPVGQGQPQQPEQMQLVHKNVPQQIKLEINQPNPNLGNSSTLFQDKVRSTVNKYRDMPLRPVGGKEFSDIQQTLKGLLANYDLALKDIELEVGHQFGRSERISRETRDHIDGVVEGEIKALLESLVGKGIDYLDHTLDDVAARERRKITNPYSSFIKGFMISTGFGSKQFVYTLALLSLQRFTNMTTEMTLGIRRDLFWSRVLDSIYIGPAHNIAIGVGQDSVKKWVDNTVPKDPVTLPQGNHNWSTNLAQRVLTKDLPLAACFWVCYHAKGLLDSLTGNVNPWLLATSGAAASMIAGGLTGLAAGMATKALALTQMQGLKNNLTLVKGGNPQEQARARQEILDLFKGVHYQAKLPGSESTPCYMLTKAISSIVGSMIMLYYLAAPTVEPLGQGGPTSAPTMAPEQSSNEQPDNWSMDSQFARTGFAMALYLVGWCLLRPLLEAVFVYPSSDRKFNQRIDKVRDVFTPKQNENIQLVEEESKEEEKKESIEMIISGQPQRETSVVIKSTSSGQ